MTLEKIEEKEEELNFNQINDLFRGIILGKDVTEIVHTSRGDFKIKFPRAKDLEEIGRRTALRLNGISVRCFDADTYNLMNFIATLDVVVVDGPDWWKLAKKERASFGWSDIPDQFFIQEVYALAYNFRQKVQEQIRQNPAAENKRMASNVNSDADSEPGLFDGLEGES